MQGTVRALELCKPVTSGSWIIERQNDQYCKSCSSVDAASGMGVKGVPQENLYLTWTL